MELPRRAENYRHKLTGFVVDYKDDRVLKWLPIYSDLTVNSRTPTGGPAAGPTVFPESVRLKFYTVREGEFTGGHLLDTPDLPKVGYLSGKPDLSISAVESVAASDTSSEAAITINLGRSDATQLRDFTAANVGNRVAIEIGTNVVAAPRIRSPVENGRLRITFPKIEDRDRALALLQNPKH